MIQHKQKKQNQTPPKNLSSRPRSEQQTFLEHIYEVRKRLFWIAVVLVVTSAIGFQIKDQLVAAVMLPLDGQKLIYLTPGGGFSFIFTLSLYFGILFTIPTMVYQLFRFLQPMMGKTSKKFITAFLITSTVLAAGGALFGYFVTIPAALHFLSAFAGESVVASLTSESYLNFVVTYVLGLALIFQLPLLLFIADHIRPFPPGTLMAAQRYVIIGATVLAAVITPTPDAFNMAVVGIPVVFVYEIGAMAVVVRRHGRKENSLRAPVQAVRENVPSSVLTASIESTDTQVKTTPRQVPAVPPAIAKPNAIAHQRPRAIDGFSRQSPSRVIASPVVTPRPVAPNPRRSIDGFITA